MSEKTEKPTPKKLRDARRKGQIAKSKEATSTLVLCVLLLGGWALSGWLTDQVLTIVQLALDARLAPRGLPELFSWLERVLRFGATLLLALALCEFAVGTLGGFLQTRGLVVSFDPIVPRFDRLNPAQNVKKLFSLKQLYEVMRKLVALAVFGAIIVIAFRHAIVPALRMIGTPAALPVTFAREIFFLLAVCALAAIVAAAIDYGLQLYEFYKDQRMSKDEIRREHKDVEGDPYVKAHRRALMRELMRQAEGVGTTRRPTVVVTNPTHVAVALFYERGGPPPRCVAKGLDEQAERIKAQARTQQVPILEDPPLARRLYRTVAIDQCIDSEFYEAVAEVIAWAQTQRGDQTA